MKTDVRKIRTAAIVGLAILAFIIVILNFGSNRNNWKEKTTPLSVETIKILCQNFDIGTSPLCNRKSDVYGPDFYRTITDAFRPSDEYNINDGEPATYKEVEERIGAFRYGCEPVATTGDGFSYFTCFYDLRGDRFWIIAIFFTYPEESVFRITTSSLYED